MKYLLSGLLFLCGTATLHAQNSAWADAAPAKADGAQAAPAGKAVNIKDVIYVTPANQWSLIGLKTAGDMAYFTNIDGLSELKVYVSNSEGKPVMDMRINARANGINFKKVGKGLYFLTLVNEATDEKKAFTYNRE